MQTNSSVSPRSFSHLIAAGLLAFPGIAAHASYTVIDDDLYPASVIEARSAPAVPDHFDISFPRYQSTLGPSSSAALNTLLSHMQNASIHIVGRPDATLYPGTGKLATIARSRAINIRDYLVRRGIPAGSITVETDNSPNPQLNGNSYPSDIYITNTNSRASAPFPVNPLSNYAPADIYQSKRYAAARAYASSEQPAYSAPAPVVAVPASPAPQARDEQLIQFINQAVESGKMNPTVALKLLRSLMESESNNAPQQPQQQTVAQSTTPQLRAPAPAPVPLFVATPALIRNDHWVLDKNLTLRGNLDAWSKTAGWNPSIWQASNYYEVTATSTIEGGFPDVLRKIADSTGLNICAKTREKIVRVTDATTSCK